MNANAQDFDPNRIASGEYQPSNVNSSVDPSSYHGGGAQDAPGPDYYMHAPAESGPYYDPGYQEYTDPAGQYFPPYPTPAEYLDPASESLWDAAGPEENALPGYYFPIANLQPQLYDAPISALAYDDEYEAIYVASHTQPMGRHHGNRASMMVTHSTLDGILYSSCAAHPEADSSTMDSLYQIMYGGGSPVASSNRRPAHIPAHAYQPPYGMDETGNYLGKRHMGITTLLPMKGYVASVSPSAVRVHSHGGLCMSDHDILGMVSGTIHPGSMHVSVGGAAMGAQKSHVHCMDLYQGLRIVSSNTFRSESISVPFGVMCMATNHDKQTIVVGCSDGTLRLLDASWRARGGNELAKVRSHPAGVSNVAVSNDGNLVCTTGFASRSSSSIAPYAFPDQHLFIYDVRFLGRGGILHPFSAVNGGPRLVCFLPDVQDQPHNRLLVASGQAQGGIQIITPFENDNENPANFLIPPLAHRDSMTALHVSEQYLAIGTSQCNVLQFEMTGYDKPTATHSYNNAGEFIPSGSGAYGETVSSRLPTALHKDKKPLVLPSYIPELPPLSLDPTLLQSADPGIRNGATDKLKSIFTSYILCADPTAVNDEESSAFGAFANNVLLTAPKRTVSKQLIEAASKVEGDVLSTVLTSKVNIDLLEDTRTDKQIARKEQVLPNPNRLLYSRKLAEVCYKKMESRGEQTGRDRRNDANPRNWRDRAESDDTDGVPKRYRRTLRPSHHTGAGFSHAHYNDTGIWPGWDYQPSMPNAYAPPVLLALYFIPEIRSIMLSRQFDNRLFSSSSGKVPPLSTELGFLFHQIECLSQYARIYPDESTNAKVGAFVPTNFLTSFAAMPEAEALALLDGAPAAVEKARRPEAFLRFLLHHLNKEVSTKKVGSKIIDGLHGSDFVSINAFINGSGPPSTSKHRALTVDLSYEPFVKGSREAKFCEVLRHALSKESPLRAWCAETRSYETVVQRKIATSLPAVLALSCCCAGKNNGEGLSIWRTNAPENGHWLPEMVEIEITDNGNVIVREWTEEVGSSDRVWVECKRSSQLPPSIADIVTSSLGSVRKHRYRLDAVLSFVRDDMDAATIEQLSLSPSEEASGHHVLHARIPSGYKRRAFDNQRMQAARIASTMESASKDATRDAKLTLTSGTNLEVFRKRIEDVDQRLDSLDQSNDEWVLFNGFVVSSTVVEDARAFHMPFKEPCLVIFRAVDDITKSKKESKKDECEFTKIPTSVMRSRSLSTGRPPDYNTKNDLPGAGDLIAFDAEFVSVQEEESILTNTGSKLVIRETRYALARVSVIDCRSGNIILDDYVLPCEAVVDYLTRFSGIVEGDLDPKNSPHHLISMRSAYLKLRCLTECGCIFVGHGLTQDFLTVNLVVPPDQIIDTVEIYHQDRMRWISLRFLTNYVFGRDMQQDVHDSVEDARAAYELYLKAIELKKEGRFAKFMQELYVYGAARDWKLGIDET